MLHSPPMYKAFRPDLQNPSREEAEVAAGATMRTGTGADSTIDLAAWQAGARSMTPSNVDGKAATASKAEAAAKVGPTSGGDVITRIPIRRDRGQGAHRHRVRR